MTGTAEPGAGMAYIRPEPRCPAHGRMHHDFAADTWICAGWDGEGCDHKITAEEQEWRPLGLTGPVTLDFRIPVTGDAMMTDTWT